MRETAGGDRPRGSRSLPTPSTPTAVGGTPSSASRGGRRRRRTPPRCVATGAGRAGGSGRRPTSAMPPPPTFQMVVDTAISSSAGAAEGRLDDVVPGRFERAEHDVEGGPTGPLDPHPVVSWPDRFPIVERRSLCPARPVARSTPRSPSPGATWLPASPSRRAAASAADPAHRALGNQRSGIRPAGSGLVGTQPEGRAEGAERRRPARRGSPAPRPRCR